MTLQQLKAYVESEFGLTLSMLSCGVSILYSDYMNKKKLEVTNIFIKKKSRLNTFYFRNAEICPLKLLWSP
jgi:hypothetical protein